MTNICSCDRIQSRTDVRKYKFGLAGYKGGSCMKKYLIALVMIVMIMSCFFGKTLVMANEESDDTVYNRYYTTIEVEKGDTLWSIAKTYYHHSGMSVREYVYELKLINGMVSDEIRAGNVISVEYYAETPGNPYIK